MAEPVKGSGIGDDMVNGAICHVGNGARRVLTPHFLQT
jgi:hypothetical protein